MKVYVLLCEDRHADPAIQVFYKAEDAVNKAIGIAERGAEYNGGGVEVSRYPDEEYRGTYSCEGDYVAVYAKEVE
jgi:hypothetical protein